MCLIAQANRLRGWWAHTKGVRANQQAEATAWFNSCLSAFKARLTAHATPHYSDYITIDGDLRQQQSKNIGVSCWSHVGPRDSKRAKEDGKYKMEHLHMFGDMNVEWPVNLSDPKCPSEI